MRIVYGHSKLDQPMPGVVMTVGTFDGVHRGHQAIIERVVRQAREAGGTSVVYSFYPPPWRILGRTDNPFLITTFEDKASLIARMGVDVLVTEGFTSELRALDAEGFVRDVLVRRFAPREVLVGYDFRFGQDRRGDVHLLQRELASHDATAHQVDAVEVDGVAISSTTIRRAVVDGDLERASRLLGRHHFVSGAVVRGRGRGRAIGFPTANISARTELIPAPGVYAVVLESNGDRWPGVANLGYRPTFDERGFSIEAHLFDFSGDLYGVKARLHLVRRVRAERRFESAEALVEQIHRDAADVREMLPLDLPGT